MSTILKAGASGAVLKRLATVDLADHLREANGVIDDARRRAASHIARARQQAKLTTGAIHQKAHEEGFRKGLEEGASIGRREAFDQATEAFHREHAHLVSDLQRAIAQFDGLKDELRLAAQRDLLNFAVLLARKLTFAIGSLHHDAAVENVKRAIDCVGRATDLTIRIHPADRVTVESFASSVLTQTSTAVRIQADDSIAPGGCVVLNDRTEVDARLETQVDEIVALLLGASVSRGLQPAGSSAQAEACGSNDEQGVSADG